MLLWKRVVKFQNCFTSNKRFIWYMHMTEILFLINPETILVKIYESEDCWLLDLVIYFLYTTFK